jgi:hypothetical protein
MKAKDVPVGTWFMVLRTKRWYKRLDGSSEKGTIRAGLIETKKVFYIGEDEDVSLNSKET